MASAEQKLSLVAAILALFGGAAYLILRKKDQATPAGTVGIRVAGQPVPVSATVPTPDNVQARAFGPAIASVYSDGPRYTCPVGAHVEYAGDGSAWCVLNTPAPQTRHTLSIGAATVTVPTFLNPLADIWNLFSGKQTPAMPPIEKRSV
jgi:hypothetical protein